MQLPLQVARLPVATRLLRASQSVARRLVRCGLLAEGCLYSAVALLARVSPEHAGYAAHPVVDLAFVRCQTETVMSLQCHVVCA